MHLSCIKIDFKLKNIDKFIKYKIFKIKETDIY
jgi:hypothetical protein